MWLHGEENLDFYIVHHPVLTMFPKQFILHNKKEAMHRVEKVFVAQYDEGTAVHSQFSGINSLFPLYWSFQTFFIPLQCVFFKYGSTTDHERTSEEPLATNSGMGEMLGIGLFFLYDLILPHGEVSKSLSWVLEWNWAGPRVLIDEYSRFPPNLCGLFCWNAPTESVGSQASEQEANQHGEGNIHFLSVVRKGALDE
jgi:hypothetical protein